MKATGIVRRIDDLGRVVVPKEIRRTMRIREGQAMEIYTGREGEIILKKYSPIEELAECAAGFTKSISTVTGCLVCVSDQEQIVAANGPEQKNYLHGVQRRAQTARRELSGTEGHDRLLYKGRKKNGRKQN